MTIRHVLGVALSGVLLLTGCGSGAPGSAQSAGAADALSVIAGFYPLEFAVHRIGGRHVQVRNLTKPGAEAHDLEVTPRDVAAVSQAQLVVYVRGFQPALDKAVDGAQPGAAMNVATSANLIPTQGTKTGGRRQESGAVDPHFWLDPVRYGAVSDALATRLGELDPAHVQEYRSNAIAFERELTVLDEEFQKGLATCRSRDLVTGHAAFGYLAERYDLTQVSVGGLAPESEPDPAALAAVADIVKRRKVTTIYAQTLASPAVAETIARETGATTAVLDPLEGLPTDSGDANYLSIMRINLATLRKGQGCS